jgi:hypothetical protein
LPDLPSVNQFDMAAVMAKLDPISVPIINKTFGVSITLSKMIDLLHRFQGRARRDRERSESTWDAAE